MIKNNYIDKDIKEVGYRHVDDENYQSFYVTRMEDQFIIQYAETYKGDSIHTNMIIKKSELEQLLHDIQHQLLDDNWKPQK